MLQNDQDVSSNCRQQELRRAYLDEHPECWQWDDFLSQRFAERYRENIVNRAVAKHPAEPSSVIRIEERLGIPLPHGYRSFLLRISDGSSLHDDGGFTFPPVLYSTKCISEKLDSTGLKRLNGEPLIGWHEMRLASSGRCRISQTDHEDDYTKPPIGFLEIGDHGHGKYYLGLRGQLRGTIWGCCPEQDEPLTVANLQEHADYPETHCTSSVQEIPLDSIRAIYSLVLERMNDAYGLAE